MFPGGGWEEMNSPFIAIPLEDGLLTEEIALLKKDLTDIIQKYFEGKCLSYERNEGVCSPYSLRTKIIL